MEHVQQSVLSAYNWEGSGGKQGNTPPNPGQGMWGCPRSSPTAPSSEQTVTWGGGGVRDMIAAPPMVGYDLHNWITMLRLRTVPSRFLPLTL